MAGTGKYHVRSISLPSRSHPTTIKIEDELNRIKTWKASSTSTSVSICNGLSGLEDLYNSTDDILNMASTKEVLCRNLTEKCLDELLDGFLRLLDFCGIARDAMLRFGEQVQALQSALRRKKGDSSIKSDVAEYTCFRKKMKKDAKKLIAALKQINNKFGASSPLFHQDQHMSALIRVLREVIVMSSVIFQALLLFLAIPASKSNHIKWSLVSKLMHKGVVACEEKQENANEFGSVDDALWQDSDLKKIQTAQKQLEALEISIGDLETRLESVFRRLIKTRASLLNIIS